MLCAQSGADGAAKLMAVYRARLSTQHREQDARASPADGDARVARFNSSRAGTTATPNRASLDAAIEEKVAGASRARVENTSA